MAYCKLCMVKRPTILDLAKAAGVSVATVDRVLNRRLPVREDTALRVVAAAEQIGFHATGLLRQRVSEVPKRSFGFLLQKKEDEFYRNFGAALVAATQDAVAVQGRAFVEYMDEIIPSAIASRIMEAAQRCNALAVVAVDHPLVNQAIGTVSRMGKPVLTLLSDVAAPERAAYISADSRRCGRTAAWAISRLAKHEGKVGIMLGSHRYLSQELAESSFRSYMREHAAAFQVMEPLVNLDDPRIAHEAALNMISSNPDLVGVYVAGGGAEGLIAALREENAAHRVIAVCNELTSVTRSGLIDGALDLVLDTPTREISRRAVDFMARATTGEVWGMVQSVQIPATLVVSESL